MVSKKMQGYLGGSSVIRAMFEEGAKLKKEYGEDEVFDFSIGNPNIEPPREINEAIVDIAQNLDPVHLHGYMSNAGYEDVREAIASNLNKRFATDYTQSNLIMVTGAAAGLNIALKSILDPGDEVLVFTPYFMEYGNYVKNYDGVLVEVPTEEGTFLPNIQALEKAINQNTKALILNNPNNPTGVVYPKGILEDISKVLKSKQEELGTNIYLISDEPYRELVYDGREVPFPPKFYDNTILVYSYSKSLSIPGERIGYILVPDMCQDAQDLLAVMTVANRISGFVNAPSLIQKVIGRCADLSVNLEFYNTNRVNLYQGLRDLGYEAVYPEGAFYIFLKSPIEDEMDFVQRAKKYNILMVPGSTFKCPGYMRLAYCVSEKTVLDSLLRFKDLMEEVKEVI